MSRMPPWVPSLDTCLTQAPRPHTFTFCTISSDNRPHARTCVLRSWLFNDRSTGVLVFTTDKRSCKVADLTHNNGNFEACLYFANASKQFRLSGFAQVLSLDQYPNMTQHQPQMAPIRVNSPPSPVSRPNLNQTQTEQETRGSSDPPPVQQEQRHLRPDTSRNRLPIPEPETQKAADSWYSSLDSKLTLPYPVYSPAWREANKTDLQTEKDLALPPPSPTSAEWKQEYLRIWNGMSPAAKASFRRPYPGSIMSPASAKLIDAISRGVDGSSDEAGLENFNVIVMFVNGTDIFADKVSRRAVYERGTDDDWTEQEVCP